jgi:hypothetical protein
LPNLRKAGGSFVPVVLVTDVWSGSGAVNGKVPTTGGGTWLGTGGRLPTYSSGIVNTDGGTGQFVHSATYQNASILATVYPDGSNAGNTPLYAYARLNGTPDTFTNGYVVQFASFGGGDSPHVRLNKVVGGVNTELFYSYADPVGLPTVVTISGALITIRVNGAVAIQLTDTSISAAGYWGYGCTWADNGDFGSLSQVGPVTIQTA